MLVGSKPQVPMERSGAGDRAPTLIATPAMPVTPAEMRWVGEPPSSAIGLGVGDAVAAAHGLPLAMAATRTPGAGTAHDNPPMSAELDRSTVILTNGRERRTRSVPAAQSRSA